MAELSKDQVLAAVSDVIDPVSKKPLATSGLLSGLVIRNGNVGFSLEITADQAGLYEAVRKEAEDKIRALPGVISATVVLTAERASSDNGPSMQQQGGHNHNHSHGGGKQIGQHPEGSGKIDLPNVRTILVVASGKGGVGKSTVSANIAVALKSFGLKVGLLDADIYGPSTPKLLGLNERPKIDESENRMYPLEAHGIKFMSIGLMVGEDAPLVWRGPMMAGAMTQLFTDTEWGDLDVLVVDMPPGTGDAQLTLAQRIPVTGAVIVSTPQDIALIDAKKGYRMFEKTDVPVYGIIENMSYFNCPKCGERTDIFGHGGAKETAEQMGVPFLGGIPLHINVREKSDQGTPVVLDRSNEALREAFINIAEQIQDKLMDAM